MKPKPLQSSQNLCEHCKENKATAYANQKHLCNLCFILLTNKTKPNLIYTCLNCGRRFLARQPKINIFCCEKCRHQFIKNSKNKLKGGKARNP